MSNVELKFSIELTKMISSKTILNLEGAYALGKERSLISREFIKKVYTLNQ